MSQKNCSVLCWNVRGLNDGVKRASVRNLISASNATIVCLQETKIESWTQSLLVETVGPVLARNCSFLPSIGAAGGILMAMSDQFFSMSPLQTTNHSVSAEITMLEENVTWCLTGVYGKQLCSGLYHGLTMLRQKQSCLACFRRRTGRRF